jgi:hypothetical protein
LHAHVAQDIDAGIAAVAKAIRLALT